MPEKSASFTIDLFSHKEILYCAIAPPAFGAAEIEKQKKLRLLWTGFPAGPAVIREPPDQDAAVLLTAVFGNRPAIREDSLFFIAVVDRLRQENPSFNPSIIFPAWAASNFVFTS